jgi:hypothetical protein
MTATRTCQLRMSFTSAVITVQQPRRHYRAHRELYVQLADQ